MVNRSQRHKIKRSIPKEYYKILFCAIITNLFLTNEDTHRLVDSKFSGALAFAYCLSNQQYYLKLIDIKGHGGVLWQSLFNPDSKYTRDNVYLHTFKISKQQHYQSAGFVFYNEDDAKRFYKRVIYRHKYVQKSFESESKDKIRDKSASPQPQKSTTEPTSNFKSSDVLNTKPEQQIVSPGSDSPVKSPNTITVQDSVPQIVSPQLSIEESINLISYSPGNEETASNRFHDETQGLEVIYSNRYVQLDSQMDKIIPRRHDPKSKKPSESQLYKTNKNQYKKPMMHRKPSYIQTKSRSSYYDYSNSHPKTQVIQTTGSKINQLNQSSFADDESISRTSLNRKNTLAARYKDLAEMPQCVRKSVIIIEDDDEKDDIDMTAIIDGDIGSSSFKDVKKDMEIITNGLSIPNDNEFEQEKMIGFDLPGSISSFGTPRFLQDINSEKNTIRSGGPRSPTASQASSTSTKTAINNVNAMLSMVGTQSISQRDTPTRFSMHKHMNRDKELFPEIFKIKNTTYDAVSPSSFGFFENSGSPSINTNDLNKSTHTLSKEKYDNSILNDGSHFFESNVLSNSNASSLFRMTSFNKLKSSGIVNVTKRNSMFENRDLEIIEDDDEVTSLDGIDETTGLVRSSPISKPNFASTSAVSLNDEKSSLSRLSRKISVRMPKLDQFVSGPKKRLSFLQKKPPHSVKSPISTDQSETRNDVVVSTINEEIDPLSIESFKIEESFNSKNQYGSSFARISRRFSGYHRTTNNSNIASSKYNSNNKKNLQISAPIPVEILEVDPLAPESPMDDFIGYKHRHNSSVSSSSGVSEFTNSNLFLSVR